MEIAEIFQVLSIADPKSGAVLEIERSVLDPFSSANNIPKLSNYIFT